MEKIPEKHLGPKLSAMERQGYASTEGVHNGKVDADHRLAQIIERSQKSRHRVMQRIAPVRAVLNLADGVNDETVAAEAKELRQLTSDYLLNERFLIGHTRRKALHQARKRIELARPYQTSKWAEKELAKIDAAIEKKGLDPKMKKRRAGVYRRKKEAEETLSEIDRRYETDWVKLEALDRKAEAFRLENTQIVSRMDTSKKALDARLNSSEIRREIAQMGKQNQTGADAQRHSTPAQMPPGPETDAPVTTARQRQSQTRIRIRATLPGLDVAIAQIETKGEAPGKTPTQAGENDSHTKPTLPSQKIAAPGNAPELLSENGSLTKPSAAKKKSPFHLTRRPQITLK